MIIKIKRKIKNGDYGENLKYACKENSDNHYPLIY